MTGRRPLPGLTPWLSLVIALAIVAGDFPVVHEHRALAPSLYNEECPLSLLATPPTATLRAPAADLATPLPMGEPAIPADAPALDPQPLLSPGARAPPTTHRAL